MTGIDDLIGQMYKSEAQYLVEAGCRDIRTSFESCSAFRDKDFEKGAAKLREAHKRGHGNIDLTPLVEYGYELVEYGHERLSIFNSESQAYRVLELAQELGAKIDEERIRRDAYDSIGNSGTECLELMEKHLGIKPDLQEILQQVYMHFDRFAKCYDLNSFGPRSFDALFYALSRGGNVDKAKLPEKERIEEVIRYELGLPQNKRRALEHLRGFEKLGLRLATTETMAKLERIAELEG